MRNDSSELELVGPTRSVDGSTGVGQLSLEGIVAKVWVAALVLAVMDAFANLEIHFYLPYLYSRVSCCQHGNTLGPQYDVTSPEHVAAIQEVTGSTDARIAACEVPPLSPGSHYWSLSSSCSNRAFVQDSAQGMMALLKPMQKLLGLAVLPIGGTVADAAGRRPVLILYCVALLLAACLSMLDSIWHAAWGDWAVFVACGLFCFSYQPKESICVAAVADLIGQHEGTKAQAFLLVRIVCGLVLLLCTAASYFALQLHLVSYWLPWLVCSCVAAFALLMVWAMPEPLPKHWKRQLSFGDLDPVHTQLYALRLLGRDRILIELCVVSFLFWAYLLGFMTTKTSFLISMGFDMQDTILPDLFGGVCTPLLMAAAVRVMPLLGVWRAHILGHASFALAFFFYGPFTLALGSRYFLGPFVAALFETCAKTLLLASVPTMLSQRVEGEHQGKCQAAALSVGTAGAVVGVPVYNHILFRATAEGLWRVAPAMSSMLLASFCVVLAAHMHCTQAQLPPACATGAVHETEMASAAPGAS